MQEKRGRVDIQLPGLGRIVRVLPGQQKAFTSADQRSLQLQFAGLLVVPCLRAGRLERTLAQAHITLQVEFAIQFIAGVQGTGFQWHGTLNALARHHGAIAANRARQITSLAEYRQPTGHLWR